MKFIDEQNRYHGISLLCECIKVSMSSYYRWRDRGENPGKRELEDRELRVKVRKAWLGSHKIYGSPRIHDELRGCGISTSRKRIARLMKEQSIEGRYNKRRKALGTDSKHGGRISPNRLRKVEVDRITEPGTALVADTTYIWTDAGWHYLAVTLDLHNREVVGWAFSGNNDEDLVKRSLQNAANNTELQPGGLSHNDRGSTYCGGGYQQLIKDLGLQSSMSAKGRCYDNAHVESFFGTLKCECEALRQSLSPRQTRAALFHYIEGFYNTRRIHSALQGKSPKQYKLARATPMGVNARHSN